MSKSEPVSLCELAEWLVERGLANDRAGYGHATGEHVAEELLRAFVILRQTDSYAPCPKCGEPSLASIADHICDDCADTYVYCSTHANLSEDQ